MIPSHKRPDAKYCSDTCRSAEEKSRHRARKGLDTGTKRGSYNVERKDYEGKKAALRERSKKYYYMATYGSIDNAMALADFIKSRDKYAPAKNLGYRSGLEVTVAKQLEQAKIKFQYEAVKIGYTKPERRASYSPDFVLPNGIIIETKGRFLTADRQKHLLIKDQHPDLDIRFVFSNPDQRISKQSKTTYAAWCQKNGFKYAAKTIPTEWIKE